MSSIAVDQSADHVDAHTFADLRDASNRFDNVLLAGISNPGDIAFVMIPRLPAWYTVMIGCCKAGVVAKPHTNLLTAKYIEYRINRSQAKIAIVTADDADKVDQIRDNCPTLEKLIVVGTERDGWLSFDAACAAGVHNYKLNSQY